MDLKRNSVAGTLESNDIMIELLISDKRVIELKSGVEKQFGEQILFVINKVLNEYDINNVKVIANDQGALDYTIEARMHTAIKRGIL